MKRSAKSKSISELASRKNVESRTAITPPIRIVPREYYQLLAFFNNTADADREDEKPTRVYYAKADSEKAAQLKRSIEAARRKITDEMNQPTNRYVFNAWLDSLRPAENFLPLRDLKVSSTAGNYRVQPDGRVLLEGDVPVFADCSSAR